MLDIISKIKQKDSDGITLLYNRYGKQLYGYSVSKWKLSEDDSWELVYKTLYKVISVIDNYSFENENKFTAFLFKIFINYLRNHYRDNKDRYLETTELHESHEKISAERDEQSNEKLSPLMQCLQKALHILEDWQRIVLLMRAQNYSYEDIAKYVSKPTDQLKVYHMRLKKIVTQKTNECIDKHE
ncbi:MAG: sigma-70 family RNA polymerase sigma factor [Bacteroidota bacterium]